jgi:hypothetical protein|tara:strand:- start:126 stop:275 length:150 start_codon:yes stop_codon:yes gene_type:complete
MIFIIFNGAFNGIDSLVLLKIIKNDKNILPQENLSKINGGAGFKRAEKQ